MTLEQAQLALANAEARRAKRDDQMTAVVNSIQVIDRDIEKLTKIIELLQNATDGDALVTKYQTP